MSGVMPPRGGAGSDRAGAEPILRATPENIRNQKSAFHIVPITPGKEEEGFKIVANPRQSNWFTRLFRRLSGSERKMNYKSWGRAITILHSSGANRGIRMAAGALEFYHTDVNQKHGKIDLTPASINDLDKMIEGVRSGKRRSIKFIEKTRKELCMTKCGRFLDWVCQDKSLDLSLSDGEKKWLVKRAMRKAIEGLGGNIASGHIVRNTRALLIDELNNRFFQGEKKVT